MFVSLQRLFDDIVQLLATLGLHFHTLLRPLCTFGLHLGSFLRSLGTLGPSFGLLFSTLGAQGQLCGLFWHPRGPKVENHEKRVILVPDYSLILRAFLELFHNNRVCVWVFVCMSLFPRFLMVFRVVWPSIRSSLCSPNVFFHFRCRFQQTLTK